MAVSGDIFGFYTVFGSDRIGHQVDCKMVEVACGEGDHNTGLFVTAILVGFVYILLYFIFVAYASIRVAKASVGKKYN